MTSARGPLLPFRSAERFLDWLARPAELDAELPELVDGDQPGRGAARPGARRRRPGARDQGRARRDHPRATGSSRATRSPSPWPARRRSRYVESEPDGLELAAAGPGGHVARLRIRLDLFELLQHQRDGYLPSVAELQGRYLDLVIFKNELSATPYQEVVLTTDGRDAHRIRREPDGRLVMTSLVTPGRGVTRR